MTSVRRLSGSRTAWAFAPGHVTGLFAPARSGPDPRARGSVGAGVVLEVGATARVEWRRGPERSIRIRGRPDWPITADVARRLWGDRPGRLEISVAHDLPIAQGFGMSAAGALATALAVAELAGISRQRAFEVAHLADLFGGGGLGGVAALGGGGLEVRDRPGVPPYGHVLHRRFGPSVFLVVAGRPLPSPALLEDPAFLDRVTSAYRGALGTLGQSARVPAFLEAAERFTDEVALAPDALRRRIRELRSPEVRVAQAMFGRSLFAVATTSAARRGLVRSLERLRLPALELGASIRGARRLVPGPAHAPGPGPVAARRDRRRAR